MGTMRRVHLLAVGGLVALLSHGAAAMVNQPAMLPQASNATLPDALENLKIQIPGACDGFRADNGATTLSSAAFSSATANFLTTDVGKPISVQGAGVNFFLLTASTNAGGTGHAVGDIVSFPGSVSIRVAKVAAGAITEYRVSAVGSSATSPATLSQSSTTGIGTGAVLNTTWQRENLVTTIASRDSPTAVQLAAVANATASGLKWGYGTDYSVKINAAMGTGAPLPQGICGVTTALAYNSQDTLVGKGAGSNGVPQTTIMWLGAVGGIPVDSGTAGGQISGINLGHYNIDGLCAAATGLRMYRTSYSTIYPTVVENTTQIGIDLDATASAGTQGVTFYDPQAMQTHACASFAEGIRWGPGTATTNVNHIKMYGPRVNTRHGDGLACYNADTNAVYSLFGQKVAGGTGNSLSLRGGPAGIQNCRANDFFASDPLGGSVAYTDTVAAANNYVEIRQESGSTCLTGDAASQNSQLCKPNSNVLQGSLKTGLANIGTIQTLYRTASANFSRNRLDFSLQDAAGTERVYSAAEGMINSNAAGAYQGILNFHVANAGVLVETARLRHNGGFELGAAAVGKNAVGLLVPNNFPIQALDTAGTARNLISLFTDNKLYVEGGSAGLVLRDNNGSATIGTSDGLGNFAFSGTVNKLTLTTPATGATLTVANGKTLTVNNTLTLAGTDGVTYTGPTTSKTLMAADYSNATAKATAHSQPANPTGTTSATAVHMGLAGAITPAASGKVLIVISGAVWNNTVADGASWHIRYGTGTAPINGAAPAGTSCSATPRMDVAPAANSKFPFSVQCIVGGLTLGTTYWIDLALAAITGGTAAVGDIGLSAAEM